MQDKLGGWEDTIVALATPQGIGAIGVIRISGTKAISIVNAMFLSKELGNQPSHTLHVGLLRNGKDVLDEVVIGIFKNPSSYTGEDIIEISCHGSPFVQRKVLDALVQNGCRLAKPGEFTQRAFLNGKLDLTQAEAVADLIASNTDASRDTAIKSMRGGFSKTLSGLREKLIRFSAMIELELDFAQEDVEFADRLQLQELIATLLFSTNQLLESFHFGNAIKNGVQVAIIGKPNAGKSTLLNTLLNEDRAIVSAIAGTTRDTIEEVLNIEGILFRLIDTAGIRAHQADVVENLGIDKSYEKMRMADLVLYLFDVNETSTAELTTVCQDFEKQKIKYVLVANKHDQQTEGTANQFANFKDLIFISAKQNANIDLVKHTLLSLAIGGKLNTESTIVTNARHYEALKKLSNALADVQQAMDNNLPGDLLALDIRQCLHYLGLITGEVTNEDQLDFIFTKFCIGK
ncbi:tRNA uridine-5-carboxymethylaminomethyl(34) synthesis GTPase MnmE [Parasediminibacterium sp. JCM 36343]|uniref:tRNA uridine-5-carboxymethylaminomethyl(34) synthesis GTPase MnmE n=1 Tax=Parasediminibacterium sp. JCM 36343 TaxID=3374279 RepID=UPI00397BDD6D